MSLNIFKRSYQGSIHGIWAKLPQDLLRVGENHGWEKIKGACKRILTGKTVDVAAIQLRWEPVIEDQWAELDRSNAYMIECGYYYENCMWIAYENYEKIKV